MKTTFVKTLCITIALLLIGNSLVAQNKTDKKTGNRIGAWTIAYNSTKWDYFDEFHLIPNYYSLAKTENEAGEKGFTKSKKDYFSMDCNYNSSGELTGLFSINANLFNQSSFSYEKITIMSGSLNKGNLDGIIKMRLNPAESKSERSIQFVDGKFKDQSINDLFEVNLSDQFKNFLDKLKPYFEPKIYSTNNIRITFQTKDNKFTQWYIANQYDGLVYIDFSSENIHIKNQTFVPFVFNKFNFKPDGFFDYNSTFSGLPKKYIESTCQYYYSAVEDFQLNSDFQIDGKYILYKSISVLDETKKLAEFNFTKGIRNGEATTYHLNSDAIKMKLNFKNDKLHGDNIVYYPSGKTYLFTQFDNGYLKGQVTSFWDAIDGILPFMVDKTSYNGITISPTAIGTIEYSAIYDLIKSFREKGHEINEPQGYFPFCVMNFKMDSTFNTTSRKYDYNSVCTSFLLNVGENIPFMRNVLDKNGNIVDFYIFDKNNAVVYSQKNLDEAKKKETELKEAMLNSMATCKFCSKEVKMRDAVITWGGCNCFDYSRGEREKVEVYGMVSTYFCSNKCRSEYEIDCCRKNGYKTE